MRLLARHYKPALGEHIEDSGIRHNVVVELNDCIEQAFYASQRPLAVSTQYYIHTNRVGERGNNPTHTHTHTHSHTLGLPCCGAYAIMV